MVEADCDNHYLNEYLQSKLPSLGLVYETYGPYVTGGLLFPQSVSDESEFSSEQQEEFESVLELLQASSETHCDDRDAFHVVFRSELLERRARHFDDMAAKQQEERELAKSVLEQRRQDEMERDAALERELIAQKKGSMVDDQQREVTLKLVQRYGYEEVDDDEEEENGGTKEKPKGHNHASGKAEGDDAAKKIDASNPNRVNVAQMQKDKNQVAKQTHHVNKKAAQEETKRAKDAKVQAKEDRRKRAQKGERKG
jgi:hypothetical protein